MLITKLAFILQLDTGAGRTDKGLNDLSGASILLEN